MAINKKQKAPKKSKPAGRNPAKPAAGKVPTPAGTNRPKIKLSTGSKLAGKSAPGRASLGVVVSEELVEISSSSSEEEQSPAPKEPSPEPSPEPAERTPHICTVNFQIWLNGKMKHRHSYRVDFNSPIHARYSWFRSTALNKLKEALKTFT
jgi:hypothetical protein